MMIPMTRKPKAKRLYQVSKPVYNDGLKTVGEYTFFQNVTTKRLYLRVTYLNDERVDWYYMNS
jgi:hypothetical protein